VSSMGGAEKKGKPRTLDGPRSRDQMLPAGCAARNVHAATFSDHPEPVENHDGLSICECPAHDPSEQDGVVSERCVHGIFGWTLGRPYTCRRCFELYGRDMV